MKQGIMQVKTIRGGRLWLALVLPWLLLKTTDTRAQQVPKPSAADPINSTMPALLADTVQVRLELQPDSLVAVPVTPAAIDSARLEWLRTPPTMRDLVCDRVSCFETDVPHQFNNSVMAYVTLFTARNRSYLQRVLERENFYFPIFEKYLAQYNLPLDLKYLAVVESALIPTAKSPVGATGLWQFMGPTAGDLRLKRDEWIDERMHPEKATEAACKHLRYLYGVFHDWELVLAAYNWGAGSVQRVMRRTGKKTFWDLYPHMPAETRNYVPTFTAIMYSMKYAESHGLRTDKLSYQYAEPMDTLGLRGQAFDLRRLSQACGYEDSLYLTRFNPEMRRAGLPAGYRPYVVRYPAAAAVHLGDVDRATLLEYCQPTAALPQPLPMLPPRLEGVEPWENRQLLAATEGPRAREEATAPRFRRVPHKVRRGETLASIAERFEVSPAQLRRWNELPKGRSLKPGKQPGNIRARARCCSRQVDGSHAGGNCRGSTSGSRAHFSRSSGGSARAGRGQRPRSSAAKGSGAPGKSAGNPIGCYPAAPSHPASCGRGPGPRGRPPAGPDPGGRSQAERCESSRHARGGSCRRIGAKRSARSSGSLHGAPGRKPHQAGSGA
ncbi:transglycosylase SLT domain-containing protein [Hymenobacter humi]|uniref:Transglycosylase SLT domain-containing protein n=1 Tax=Hymenobacter humi TaxID=1411620 RepID=A0ABW2U2Z7_9BACT